MAARTVSAPPMFPKSKMDGVSARNKGAGFVEVGGLGRDTRSSDEMTFSVVLELTVLEDCPRRLPVEFKQQYLSR